VNVNGLCFELHADRYRHTMFRHTYSLSRIRTLMHVITQIDV